MEPQGPPLVFTAYSRPESPRAPPPRRPPLPNRAAAAPPAAAAAAAASAPIAFGAPHAVTIEAVVRKGLAPLGAWLARLHVAVRDLLALVRVRVRVRVRARASRVRVRVRFRVRARVRE